MQLAPDQKTIEGDLFKAFVAAGAISKANADDPKKSSFVRCARTDKGVHAAGNIISLKLIVEEEDIVEKINKALVPQIRIWGFERTNNSFSSYQLCDSRIYEYLIPTHSLLPPHPRCYLGKKCREWAEKKGELEAWEARQEEVKGYWEKVDEEMIKPILNDCDESIRDVLEKALWLTAEQEANRHDDEGGRTQTRDKKSQVAKTEEDADVEVQATHLEQKAKDIAPPVVSTTGTDSTIDKHNAENVSAVADPAQGQDSAVNSDMKKAETERAEEAQDTHNNMEAAATTTDTAPTDAEDPRSAMTKEERIARRKLIDDGVKRLRAAYVAAKRQYRVPETRRNRLQSVLNQYLGTKNFWNYTVQKTFKDPSAKRVIKSFKVNPEPILIDGTEWLSLKVHGQSFMMHQIRKMVGMAALIVRCGCDPARIPESYGPQNMSIPKAPSLGLLLERPVFDSYNKRAKSELNKEPIDFDKFKTEMDAFKQKFIYERMYHDEEKENVFGNFFNHVDNFPTSTFLFVTSGGLEATGEDQVLQQQIKAATSYDNADAVEHERQDEHVDLVDSDDDLDRARDNAGDEG